MCHLFDFEEVRIHSKRVESREKFADKLIEDLKRPIKITDDWESCILDADIVVEASRLSKPEPLLKTDWIKKGALVIPYGTMSALEFSLPDIMDKFVMDDWGQAHGIFGALREHIDKGKITFETLHAELGEIVCGLKKGREAYDETILFWHRGLSLSDIALGHKILSKAKAELEVDGEKIIGAESGAVAQLITRVDGENVEVAYFTDTKFVLGEIITFQESNLCL